METRSVNAIRFYPSGEGRSRHPSRRSVLLGAAAFGLAAGGTGWPSPALAAEELSIAGTIGSKLVGGALSGLGGQAAGFAVGELMSVINPQPDLQAEMMKKLDQIIEQLTQLKSSVDALAKGNMEGRYETALGKVQTLVEHNHTLMDYYRNIATAGTPGALAFAKAQFRAAAAQFDVHTAAETWHNSLAGFGNAPGLLQLWGQNVYQNNPLFGMTTAKAIQDNWEYFDAEQARTVMFLVDIINFDQKVFNAGNGRQTVEILQRWHTNRQTQLGLLRGTLARTDKPFTYIDDKGNQKTEQAPLKWLPEGVIIDRGTNTVWLAKIDGYWPPEAPAFTYLNYIYSARSKNCLWDGRCPDWALGGVGNFDHLISALGGSRSNFYAAMKKGGFVFDNLPDLFRITPIKMYVGGKGDLRHFFEEGSGFQAFGRGDDLAAWPLARQLVDGEADRYWYASI